MAKISSLFTYLYPFLNLINYSWSFTNNIPAFGRPNTTIISQTKSSKQTLLHATTTPSSVSSKYFQLEEMEDKDKCTSEIYLYYDGSVTVGETDGPPPIKASGRWEENVKDGTFKMTLTRTYGTGSANTDLGEFSFNVVRSFDGFISSIGDTVKVEGGVHVLDDILGDIECGFFSMIDTTKLKRGEKYYNK